ncbi:hypothetical protein MD484_g1837, partial [Candolleomyces efflorescens]
MVGMIERLPITSTPPLCYKLQWLLTSFDTLPPTSLEDDRMATNVGCNAMPMVNALAYDEQTTGDFERELQNCIDDLDKEGADLRKSLDSLMRPRDSKLPTRAPSLLRKARFAFGRPGITFKTALSNNIEAFDVEMSRLKHLLNRVKSQRQEATIELSFPLLEDDCVIYAGPLELISSILQLEEAP